MFDSVRGDAEAAIKSNSGYLKIHNLAAAEPAILDKYQRDAHFWRLIPFSLQTTFFISFGRIFDKTKRFVLHPQTRGRYDCQSIIFFKAGFSRPPARVEPHRRTGPTVARR
jgi:hypothetical protein